MSNDKGRPHAFQNYNLHGFGDFHSGLKKISKEQYTELLRLFRGKIKIKDFSIKDYSPVSNGRGNIGGTGESREHLMLKKYVALNPESVFKEKNIHTIKVEYQFPTGDRADILLEDEFGRVIGLEIEINVEDNQFEGVLQAIKYRFMSELITEKEPGDSRAVLVAYSISKKVKALCDKYHVQHIEVDKQLVEIWSRSKDGISALSK